MKRRTFLERSTMAAAGIALTGRLGDVSSAPQPISPIRIDPAPLFELSPYLMKTVEKPLTAGSAWEFPAASVSAVELELRQQP